MEGSVPIDPVTLEGLQHVIREMYLPRDLDRGIEGTFMWLLEEIGELAAALRQGSRKEQAEEFADVLAWLATIANVSGVDLGRAFEAKYATGCPGCHTSPCECPETEKP